jgi:signal transduction histidine kinase
MAAPEQPDVRRLLDEQAALRRVATLVARGTDRSELFAAVSEEVGRLFGAEVANLVRFDDEGGEIVGGWSRDGGLEAQVGYRLVASRHTVAGRIRASRSPERRDTMDGLTKEQVTLRRIGLRAAIGAPVVLDGALWGAVLAGSTSEPFPPGDEHRLGAFGELVGQALANAEAREQLAASRKRLVEAASTERRRLERNLHDGAQQRLVGLSLTLRLAERLVDRDPAAARDALERAGSELAEALAELRELARGLHPAVLTDHGLEPALDALAARAPLPVDVRVRLEERAPEVVEAAIYYLVGEALTNVARYAGATTARVEVRAQEDGTVLAEVADDGAGGADPAAGTGLRGLADRVEALGGRLTIDSPPGAGTTLRAELPR